MPPEFNDNGSPLYYGTLSTARIERAVEKLEAAASKPIPCISPGTVFTWQLTPLHYRPWVGNYLLGWRKKVAKKARKRVLVKLIKQGHTLKGKKVLV